MIADFTCEDSISQANQIKVTVTDQYIFVLDILMIWIYGYYSLIIKVCIRKKPLSCKENKYPGISQREIAKEKQMIHFLYFIRETSHMKVNHLKDAKWM